MILCSGLVNLKNDIKNKCIVCFGAGMIANCIEDLFKEYGLWNHIACFIDNNETKNNTFVGKSARIVYSLEAFIKMKKTDFILIITCSAFYPIIKQLNSINDFDNIHCYLYPELNYEFVALAGRELTVPEKETIPRTIHYCWFGKNRKSKMAEICIDSWKRFCHDYEIIEWNESNYNIEKNAYMKEAYIEKKWAYVSDYARLDILYEYGGIYFDTDVEIINNIDMLLRFEAFIAYGEWPCVNSGAGIGAVKSNPIIKLMRDNPRSSISFYNSNGECNLTQNCIYETSVLNSMGLIADFSVQKIASMIVLPPEIIATNSILGKDKYVTDNTIALHHNGESWSNDKRKTELSETQNYYRELGEK